MSGNRPKYEIHVGLILACLFVSLPMLYALVVATQPAERSIAPISDQIVPRGDLYPNAKELFVKRNFDRIIWNTVVVTLVVVIGKTLLAMLAGFAFVYFHFSGKWALFWLVLLPLLLPTEIILLPLFRLMANLEWGVNSPRLALTIPFLATSAGAFLFRQHFSNIPRELVEAAQLDGASPLRFLWAILLPLSWNVLAAHAVLQFIAAWNQYLWPVLINQDADNHVIQQGVKNAANFSSQVDFGLLMTAGIVASLPPVIVFVILQKPFMSGFALTRDK